MIEKAGGKDDLKLVDYSTDRDQYCHNQSQPVLIRVTSERLGAASTCTRPSGRWLTPPNWLDQMPEETLQSGWVSWPFLIKQTPLLCTLCCSLGCYSLTTISTPPFLWEMDPPPGVGITWSDATVLPQQSLDELDRTRHHSVTCKMELHLFLVQV